VKVRKILRIIENAGWVLVRQKGSHRQFKHPGKRKRMEKIQVIIERSATGFAAYIQVLPGCIATGESVDEVKNGISEALAFHLEGMKEDQIKIPTEFSTDYTLQYSFDLETFLAHYNRMLTKRALSRITGINESLLSQYATGRKHPRKKQTAKIEQGLHQFARELLQISL
jgi:predicted RNase H-like HicB family nuclease